jgi:glycosyltransferase involved in cell wall biosynthesis
VYYFDILNGGYIKEWDWVTQFTDWRYKLGNFKGRYFIKKYFPKIHLLLENNVKKEFDKILKEVKPDVVHSFALQISCLPIIDVMNKYLAMKWIYSSWGSDIYFRKDIGITNVEFKKCLKRIDFLITDNKRDFRIAINKGFENNFLGVFPGNGGVDYIEKEIENSLSKRNIILIKGYNDEIGKGLNIIKAISTDLIFLLKNFTIVVFGCDDKVFTYINNNKKFENLKFKLYHKKDFLPNDELIKLMGKSYIYVANSKSDGIPNALLEAMGMGAFPIQSNPGGVTEEVIEHAKNGLLISNPNDVQEIKELIKSAMIKKEMVKNAFYINTEKFQNQYNRGKVKNEILALYEKVN